MNTQPVQRGMNGGLPPSGPSCWLTCGGGGGGVTRQCGYTLHEAAAVAVDAGGRGTQACRQSILQFLITHCNVQKRLHAATTAASTSSAPFVEGFCSSGVLQHEGSLWTSMARRGKRGRIQAPPAQSSDEWAPASGCCGLCGLQRRPCRLHRSTITTLETIILKARRFALPVENTKSEERHSRFLESFIARDSVQLKSAVSAGSRWRQAVCRFRRACLAPCRLAQEPAACPHSSS